VFVALVIQNAKSIHHIILSDSITFWLITSLKAREKFVLIFSTHFVWNSAHSKKNSARYYHKCP